MAFKLNEDQLNRFQAISGQPVVVAVTAPATTLAAAYYNGSNILPAADGSVTFTPILGTHFLTIVAAPPFPPEAWTIVEVDGAATQDLKSMASTKQVANLIIVGN